MTQTRTALTAAALFLTLLALAGIGVLQSLAQPQPQDVAVVAVAAAEPEMAHRIDAIPDFSLSEVAAFAPSVDLTADQAAQMLQVADLICEGMTAGVPLMNMADSLVWNQGLTDEEAHDFVRTVAQTHC